MDWRADFMNWSDLDDRLCGFLIDFSLEEGLVLFLKKRTKKKETRISNEISNIMKIGDYLSIFLEAESEDSENAHTLLLGRLKDLRWKSKKTIEEEYGFRFEDWGKGIKSKFASAIPGSGFGDEIEIDLSGNPHPIGKIDFLRVPKRIPLTWMKVFEASEKDVRKVLKGTCEKTGFEVKIGPGRRLSVDFQENHLTDNILIIGSYKDFLSLAIRQILRFSNLPKIVFTQEADTISSDLNRISIHEFQRLISNGFGFEYSTEEQILNAATSLNPPQIRLLSNLLVRASEEKDGASKLETLKRIIDDNMKVSNDGHSEDLGKISSFLETRDRNLDSLMGDRITIIDVTEDEESKQTVFSKFLHVVEDEINSRKRNNAPSLNFLLFIEDIEDYIPSNCHEELDSDKAISKEAFRMFVSHPDTNKIGLIMTTRFPTRVDPLICYLCPNRIFGEVFERRELMKIKEIFEIEEVEIRKLRNIQETENTYGALMNFPSRFPLDIVDGIITER
ncbi:MAG: hypothetical protein WBA22_11675 [Candidatus Methanofastidiosia archaeon]